MLAPSQLVKATVAISINKRLCWHTADISTIQSTWAEAAGLGRCHLVFAVANCLLIGRFATVTVGSYGDCWKLRRLLEAATGCQQGQQYDGKFSFYFNCYFFHTTPTNQDLRQKAVYFPAWSRWCILVRNKKLLTIVVGNWKKTRMNSCLEM